MTVTCDITPNSPCICLSRDIPEKHLLAGCLLYGYGSLPSRDAVLDNGHSRAANAVAGAVSAALEACLQDDLHYGDPQFVADTITKALRAANADLFELSCLAGQAVYVGGVIGYFCEDRYVAIAFGGAAMMLFENGSLRPLNGTGADLIFDAVGSRRRWTGTFYQGTLTSGGLLLGATEYPHDPGKCEKQLAEYTAPGIHVNTGASTLRHLLAPGAVPAAIEFRCN